MLRMLKFSVAGILFMFCGLITACGGGGSSVAASAGAEVSVAADSSLTYSVYRYALCDLSPAKRARAKGERLSH